MEEKKKFIWQGISLSYLIIGNGPERILAFHGFGQDASVYQSWETSTGKIATIYSIDLFFHGSEWPDPETPLKPAQIKDLFGAFLEEHNIGKFSLLAYSIGARLGFELMRIWPDRIERALLIAPDGIKLNFWYRLATGSAPARRLFRYTIHNPYFFLKLLDWAGKFRLIHPATGRFALSQMRNDAKREKVYSTWVVFRSLHSRVDQLIAIIRQYKLPVLVFAGEKDSVIGLKPLEEFAGKAENSRLVLLPVNHQQLIDSTATWVRDHHGIF